MIPYIEIAAVYAHVQATPTGPNARPIADQHHSHHSNQIVLRTAWTYGQEKTKRLSARCSRRTRKGLPQGLKPEASSIIELEHLHQHHGSTVIDDRPGCVGLPSFIPYIHSVGVVASLWVLNMKLAAWCNMHDSLLLAQRYTSIDIRSSILNNPPPHSPQPSRERRAQCTPHSRTRSCHFVVTSLRCSNHRG